jgi:arginine exporter protein ArgO
MSLGALSAGLLAGLGVAMPLGAIGALLIGLPARAGHRTAVTAALGVATTDALYATAAVLGGASVADAVRGIARPLQLISAGVLAALALATLVAARRTPEAAGTATRLTPGRAYLGFLALTAVNPATLGYFAALVLGSDGALQSSNGAWFIVGVSAASAAWQLVLVGGGAAAAHVLATPRGRTVLAVTSAAVMLLLAAKVAAGGL